MRNKLPSLDSILMQADAILLRSPSDIDTIREIGLKFPQIIRKERLVEFNLELELIEGQQIKLASHFITLITKNSSAFSIWHQFSEKFPITYRFIRALEVLPYSTASIERNFSQMNSVKTKKRNKLSLPQLESLR